MVPWVVNLALASVLIYLLVRRRKQRWPVIAAQGLTLEDPVSVLAGLRVCDPVTGKADKWQQGTLSRGEGDFYWTPGGSVTAQRLGLLHVESVRLSGIAEGIWSLQIDWLVLRCGGAEGPFDLAASREGLRQFTALARYGEDAARTN